MLFTGYGILLLLPTLAIGEFYAPVSLELHRWWLGTILLVCGGSLIYSVRQQRCEQRMRLAFVSFALWWAIAAVYVWASIPPLPIWGAFTTGLFMSRSWIRLKEHLRERHHAVGGGIMDSGHARV